MADISSPKSKESGGLLMSVINTLTNSADFTQREKEKSKLERAYKTSDDVLDKLVTDNHQDLMLILQSFTTITERITASTERIRIVKENLESCKNLLHCKRDELRKLWLEGVEQKTVVSLLDQIDHLRQVPDNLENYLNRKQYLQATQLIVDAVNALDGDLAGVEALRDLTAELKLKKELLHETVTDELHRQVYIKSTSGVVRVFQRHGSTRPSIRSTRHHFSPSVPEQTLSPKHTGQDSQRPAAEESGGDDILFSHVNLIAILVESLSVLGKLPETNEVIKSRMEAELLAIIQRASQQISDNAYQQGESGVLAQQHQPKYLLELLTLVFQEFRCVAGAHRNVLENMKRLDIVFFDLAEETLARTYSLVKNSIQNHDILIGLPQIKSRCFDLLEMYDVHFTSAALFIPTSNGELGPPQITLYFIWYKKVAAPYKVQRNYIHNSLFMNEL